MRVVEAIEQGIISLDEVEELRCNAGSLLTENLDLRMMIRKKNETIKLLRDENDRLKVQALNLQRQIINMTKIEMQKKSES